MTLSSGTRFGPFEIADSIGSGGMGVVYRATDTNLKRDVALKVLPESFVEDGERLARFQREAEVLASLNHPNIAQIHGLERSDGTTALIMELVDGPTLADRIAEGPVPVDEALSTAMQIADALEAAHEQGVVHRDLKPANIKLRPDGTVKVLDFGIAKAIEPQSQGGGAQTPSLTTPAGTQPGVLLGTAAYMAPEQARGKPMDRRADIWAFGCVLYEMLTGQPAFAGEDVATTLANVLAQKPNMSLLPSATSPAVRRTLELCLETQPKNRLADAGDVRLALEGRFETSPPAGASSGGARRLWPAAVAALVTGSLVTGLVLWSVLPPPTPREAVNRFAHAIPAAQELHRAGRNVLAFSPSGRHFVYNALEGLYLRDLGELDARLIRGTEGEDIANSFFSPDGQSVGYWSARDRALKRIAISGGAPVVIVSDVTNPNGAIWAPDGTILFGQASEGVLRAAAGGGEPEVVVEPRAGEVLSGPELRLDV